MTRQMRTCGLSDGLQQDALSNAEFNGFVRRCKSIQAQIDTVQEIVRAQCNHGTKQVAQDLN